MEEFEKDQYKFLLICLVEFACEAIWSQTFVLHRVFKDSILLLAISQLNYLFLLDSVLVSCLFPEAYPFFLGCQICWHIIFQSILLRFFVFLQYYLLSPLFLVLFLVSLARGFSVTFTLSKNMLLVLLIFFLFFFSFFNPYFIYFLCDLYFLPFTDFRFCLFFF